MPYKRNVFKPPEEERAWYGLTKKRGRGGAAVKGAAAGAAAGSIIPGIGTGIGAAVGGVGGLLFGGESEDEKVARLREQHLQRLLDEQAMRLEGQAAGELSPADIAAERGVMGEAGRLGQALGQQAGASFGRRGLAWSPAAAEMGMQTRTAVGQGALETLQRQRAERQSLAEGRLASLQMGQLGMTQQQIARQQQESAEFNELLVTVMGLMAGDPELAALFGGGGGNAPGVMQTLGG